MCAVNLSVDVFSDRLVASVRVSVWLESRSWLALQVIMFCCRLKSLAKIGVKHLFQIIAAVIFFRVEEGRGRIGGVCAAWFQSGSSEFSPRRGSSASLNLSAMASNICWLSVLSCPNISISSAARVR